MELEALHGTIVRRARENGVDVPMNDAVYAILRPWSQRNQQRPE
jgi:2-dehydropantoate 2-reductase